MITLRSILEEDKERLLSRISGADTETVIRETQMELDRMLITFNDRESGDEEREAASGLMQTARSAVGLLDTQGQTKIYGRTEYESNPSGKKQEKLPVRFWIFLIAGLVFLLWTIVNTWMQMKDAGMLRQLGILAGLVLSAAGFCLAGVSFQRKVPGKKEELRTETTVDPEKVWRQLFSITLTMDKTIEEIRSAKKIRRRQELSGKSDAFDPAELELMAQLLEGAYGRRETDDQAEEMCSQLKYYLHQKDIDVIDYETAVSAAKAGEHAKSSRQDWFDLIPAYDSGTIRPALAMGDLLLKKGLASNG